MCANSEGSGETARMRRLACAFAGRLCDKYHNLMSWLNLFYYWIIIFGNYSWTETLFCMLYRLLSYVLYLVFANNINNERSDLFHTGLMHVFDSLHTFL